MTIRDGKKSSPQEEEEEDKIGNRKHGEKTNNNRELIESKICNPEEVETPIVTEVTDTVMWENTSQQIMGMDPEKEKGAQVPEDI